MPLLYSGLRVCMLCCRMLPPKYLTQYVCTRATLREYTSSLGKITEYFLPVLIMLVTVDYLNRLVLT